MALDVSGINVISYRKLIHLPNNEKIYVLMKIKNNNGNTQDKYPFFCTGLYHNRMFLIIGQKSLLLLGYHIYFGNVY